MKIIHPTAPPNHASDLLLPRLVNGAGCGNIINVTYISVNLAFPKFVVVMSEYPRDAFDSCFRWLDSVRRLGKVLFFESVLFVLSQDFVTFYLTRLSTTKLRHPKNFPC